MDYSSYSFQYSDVCSPTCGSAKASIIVLRVGRHRAKGRRVDPGKSSLKRIHVVPQRDRLPIGSPQAPAVNGCRRCSFSSRSGLPCVVVPMPCGRLRPRQAWAACGIRQNADLWKSSHGITPTTCGSGAARPVAGVWTRRNGFKETRSYQRRLHLYRQEILTRSFRGDLLLMATQGCEF